MTKNNLLLPLSDEDDDLPVQFLIKGLLAPGLTIVASEDTYERYILQEQMAVSIATGQKFLKSFEVVKSHVLFVTHGPADDRAMKDRLMASSGIPPNLSIVSGWPKLGQGAEDKLRKKLAENKDIKIAFLGDYSLIKGAFDPWYRTFITGPAQIEKPVEMLTVQYLNRQKGAEETTRLREFAEQHGVSIVLGHELTTQGKLREREVLRYRDTEIHLRFFKRSGNHKMEVVRGSSKVPTNSWNIIFDDKRSIFLPAESLGREKDKKKDGQLALLPNEIAILNALLAGEVMSLAELAQKTGVKRSTVNQRLDALQTEKKGQRVVSFEGDGKTLYLLNPDKERDW
jgi:biotin operon repressor